MAVGQAQGGHGQAPQSPAVNASVELAAEGWAGTARSRVEDRTPAAVVVARPTRAGDAPVRARVGDQMLLAWTTEDARYELPVVLEAVGDGHVPTWALRPQGPARRQQRRDAFRLEVALAAQLGTDTTPAALAKVHDVSEGGLRCTPPSGTDLAVGDTAWVELSLPEGLVRLDAQVVRVDERGEVSLRFLNVPEATAERVRGYLISEQLARRARLAT